MSSALDDAFELLEAATRLEEEESNRVEAATKYYESCYLMKRYLQRLPDTTSNIETRRLIESKVEHYEKLASALIKADAFSPQEGKREIGGPLSPLDKHCYFFEDSSVIPVPVPAASPRLSSETNSSLVLDITKLAGEANAKLAHALDLDERGQENACIDEYMAAADLYLQSLKIAAGPGTESVAALLKRRLQGALDRVEQLKLPASKRKTVFPEEKVREQKRDTSSGLTDEEIAVLKSSSLIASGIFLPWSTSDATKLAAEAESSTSSHLWIDPDGPIKLSSKQMGRFHKWARPKQIAQLRHKTGATASLQKPVMVKTVTPYTIQQKYVTDCSFISSLIICAAFERRFGKRLVTSLIYPQTADGRPMYNPSGKYMVKLWLNGVARAVVVDDFLPIDRFGNLLCSQTSSKNSLELWVPIIEKAYMKLCGGYDFPGSNSGVDMFSLTGWIPERIFFPKDPNRIKDFETPSERAWERLYSASSFGDCLITASTTSDLTQDKADEIGLITGHAYAVLSVVQTKNGTRLLQLKNPWAYKSWRGKYSCHDHASWSNGLRKEVGYDPVLASKQDDGIFWVAWDDFLVYFQNIHLSWHPGLFKFQSTTHANWPLNQGPRDDTFNMGENPQYIITFSDTALTKKATLWILLSRHVTKQEQEGVEATDFLTVHIHRNTSQRERVWYPGGEHCTLNGAYSNNPHVLVRYDVSGPSDKYLSLVLSQYKKSRDLSFTLSCFCTEHFSLTRPAAELAICRVVNSEWTVSSAGGPPGAQGFDGNPMWAVLVPRGGACVQIRCSAVKSFAVNVMLVQVDCYGKRVKWIHETPCINSGDYRHGFVATERKQVPEGSYTLICSTFHPGQTGKFQLKVNSSRPLNVEPIA